MITEREIFEHRILHMHCQYLGLGSDKLVLVLVSTAVLGSCVPTLGALQIPATTGFLLSAFNIVVHS
jgi:hypothetical protein